MMQKLISLGSKFRRKFDCSHIVIEGKNVFVSLTNSFDNVAGIILDDRIHQTHQTSRNIEVVRSEGRAGIANVISACCIFPDAAAWEAMSAIHGVIF